MVLCYAVALNIKIHFIDKWIGKRRRVHNTVCYVRQYIAMRKGYDISIYQYIVYYWLETRCINQIPELLLNMQ